VVNKRPIRGHGREIVQLGVPIADVDNVTASFKGRFSISHTHFVATLFVFPTSIIMTNEVSLIESDR